jgi:hypothetical protein
MINEATILGADIKAVESYIDNKLEEYNLAHSDSPVLLEGIVSVSPFEEFSGLKKFPEHFVRLACYFSSIGSEGHWIHVDAIVRVKQEEMNKKPTSYLAVQPLFVAKTLSGKEHAQKLVTLLSEWLYA